MINFIICPFFYWKLEKSGI